MGRVVVLARLLAPASRPWLVTAGAAVIGLLGGLAYALTVTPVYESSTTVLFSLIRGTSVSELAEGSSYVRDLVPSYAAVVTTPAVLEPVTRRLDPSQSAQQVAERVSVVHEPGSEIMEIRVRDTSPTRSAELADAIRGQLIAQVGELSQLGSDDEARIGVTTVSPAAVPTGPASPDLPLDAAVGLLAGLVGAASVRVGTDRVVSSPVRSAKVAARVASARLLGAITHDPESSRRPLPVSTHPYLRQAEEFRLLLTRLLLEQPPGKPLCVAVTSPLKGEGRTTTAVNLAIAMSHTAERVLLVDADLHHPGVADLLGLDPAKGLSSVLADGVDWEDLVGTWVTQIWGKRALSVLPAGTVPPNPGDLIASPAMAELLARLRDRYDAVILDTPPLLSATDGAILAGASDGALLLVGGGRSRQRQVRAAVGRLRLAGASVLGVVLNRASQGRPFNGLSRPAVTPTLRLRRALHSRRG
jgi:succinoglycan biosynthesis transport protein ExoP